MSKMYAHYKKVCQLMKLYAPFEVTYRSECTRKKTHPGIMKTFQPCAAKCNCVCNLKFSALHTLQTCHIRPM